MKRLLVSMIALAASPALAAVPSQTVGGGVNTSLYHSYDGLVCTDCHTLHNSDNNQRVAGAKGTHTDGPFINLLKKGSYTDVCLSCHKEGFNTSATADMNGVANLGWTAPIVMTLNGTRPAGFNMPAGDFYFSAQDAKKGHNPAYTVGGPGSAMMPADATLADSPPGNAAGSLAGEWNCHSCHGMHSRFSDSYAAWRQLNRKVNGKSVTGDVSGFGVETVHGNVTQDPAFEPIKSNSRGYVSGTDYFATRADTNALEGADLVSSTPYGDTNKNVYRGGFSSYCAACHGDFHGGNAESKTVAGNTSNGSNWIRHPTNLALSASSKYGAAAYTAVITNSTSTNPNPSGYDWKYPLVQPDNNFVLTRVGGSATLNPDSRIMCLTCHKAHASQYDNMVRWDAQGHSFIASGATDFEGEASNGDNIAYGCGKCHQKGGKVAFRKNGF